MSARIAILADTALAPASPHALAPLARIFDPVLSSRAVCMTRFSDFPRIILCGTSEDVSENSWRDMVVDLQMQLLADQIVLRHDLPAVIFCPRRIDGSVGLLPPGFLIMEPAWPS